jgi:GT2 family glycosyltransferase
MGYGMMTRRQVFMDAGGFDASFDIAYWDVDYCLKLIDRGYRITYTPYARLNHHIPVPTLSELIIEPDATRFKTRWQQAIDRDPYFNPNFSRELESFNYEAPVHHCDQAEQAASGTGLRFFREWFSMWPCNRRAPSKKASRFASII